MAYKDKSVAKAKAAAYYQSHKEEISARRKPYMRAYYAANRDMLLDKSRAYSSSRKDIRAQWNRRRLYGLPIGEWDRMLAELGGKCGLCREGVAECVDHDHATGLIRGLLCRRCNLLLAALDDPKWMVAANRYLGRGKDAAAQED